MLPAENLDRGLYPGDPSRLRAAMHRLLYLNGNLTVGFMGEGERRETEDAGMGPQVLPRDVPYAISPSVMSNLSHYLIPTTAASTTLSCSGLHLLQLPFSCVSDLRVGFLTPSTLPHFLGASITNGWYHVEFSNRSMTWPDWTMKV